jgi:endonuclease/exonuclease/phosphatase family metal-dependent hydrolase
LDFEAKATEIVSPIFKLATYNIHGFIGRGGEYTPQRTLQQIEQLDADVIALQEVRADNRTGMELLTETATTNHYKFILGPTMKQEPGQQYGNVLLFRGELIDSKLHNISHTGREPRGAIEAHITIQGEHWRIFAAHLGLSPAERRMQIKYLLKEMERDSGINTALMGDLNEWYLWGRPMRWLKRYFRISHQPATFPSRWPFLALDRIWVYPAQRIKTIYSIKTAQSQAASDHLPLVAEIFPNN